MKTPATDCQPSLRDRARHSLRHFLADFTQLEREYPHTYPKSILRAEGAYVYDEAGHRLLDAGTHLGACQIGHGSAEVAERIARQIKRLEFIALDGGISHPYAVALAQRLAGMVLCDDPIFSFTNSGSESNELAFKIARQYHRRRGQPQRVKILSRVGSYHGSTYAAAAATGVAAFKEGFGPLPEGFIQGAQPSPGRCGQCGPSDACSMACFDAFSRTVENEGPATVAAIIAEPVAIPQAVKVPHPEYFTRLRKFCDHHGILLIIDEVVCGFGRTGKMFGAEHFGVRGDIVTYAKGLTSGYVPMGAVAVSRRVEEVFKDSPLLHLNTYAGHPVACEAAMAVLDITERDGLVAHAARMQAVLRRELERMQASVPRVRHLCVIGLLSSTLADISDQADPDATVRKVRKLAYDHGLLVRISRDGALLGAHFYPPLVVSEADIVSGVKALGQALEAI
ncbi:aminotransferase family protein [Verminephrobacter aporrectodeae]|uniref:aminotransferase family protein n=1 Tax=Verminephrobacter aporrectodeae TaxID=1110389 RepID=UPI002243BD9A|nr:aminotransferase class III-fold pyridoxal phosphate-dependent enzyme [Verminephrobacter aporrectodeae]MCW8175958.1 aspartate aminotransferase family protein [Verminephrobacter aporrectodeae subsp. tuberculatae]MCW8197047.1 aspartate aminotransferase family protein [Verminephrobacter aporrectodeae subsp. tuberculatae]MCW8201503.1 aspartate aminotransferase family protein [Verminephrobacter aporrectodeae subsp. tuberculatae]